MNIAQTQQEQHYAALFDFPGEHPALGVQAGFKCAPEDFFVEEQLKFELSGEGQHLCVLVEKRWLNTLQVLNLLARFFEVPARDIGYLGMKDKVAVTRQWFSIDLAQSPYDEQRLTEFESLKTKLLDKLPDLQDSSRAEVSIQILACKRNVKKLHIGQLKGNRFEIVLRDVGDEKNQTLLAQRLACLRDQGFPNYFGEQRFGYQQHNVQQLLNFRHLHLNKRKALRSRLLSSARALGFNTYLAERIRHNTVRRYVEGDVLQFADGKTVFTDVQDLQDIAQRLQQQSLVITGPLYGMGEDSMASAQSLLLEQQVRQHLQDFLQVIDVFEMKPARRALLAKADAMRWNFSGKDLFLQFELGAGVFASVLVSELCESLGAQGH